MKSKTELLRKLSDELFRVTRRRAYTISVPCRAYVHLKDVSKPCVIQNGASIAVDKDAGDLTVKDALGEVRGWFNLAVVSGWWLEREPVDFKSKISAENMELIIAELNKCGMVSTEDPSDSSASE